MSKFDEWYDNDTFCKQWANREGCRAAWNAAIEAAVKRLKAWKVRDLGDAIVPLDEGEIPGYVDAADHAWRLVNGLRTEQPKDTESSA